jgi:hypothetical protein
MSIRPEGEPGGPASGVIAWMAGAKANIIRTNTVTGTFLPCNLMPPIVFPEFPTLTGYLSLSLLRKI